MTDPSRELRGTVHNIVYQNAENGYTVMRTTQSETLCGMLVDTQVNLDGAQFVAKGSWQHTKKFGMQFQFDEFAVNESKLFYFLCRIVKGIGKKLAKELLARYGEEQLEIILEKNPQELVSNKGIKQKKLKMILNSWNQFRCLKEIADVLIPYGASQAIVNRIYRHFQGDSTISSKIKENPYLLTEVKGIGFKTADKIARRMGIAWDSPFRIIACIEYVILGYTYDEGNSCMLKTEIYQRLVVELTDEAEPESTGLVTNGQIDDLLRTMESQRKIVFLPEDKLTTSFLFMAEKTILDVMTVKTQLRSLPIVPNIEQYISEQEMLMAIVLSPEQKSMIRLVDEGYHALILCGYAGTGKSTISRAILNLLTQRYARETIMCCALSGIASDRIRKTSGFSASTIQSLLMQAEKSGNLLPYKVLLVDESSMVNSELLYKLLVAIPSDTLFILVGDPAQLAPIGAGNPFHDLLHKKIVPFVELTKIYRQSEDKVITLFANDIREARVPEGYLRNDFQDFHFEDQSIPNYYALKNTLKDYELKELRDNNGKKILQYILAQATVYKTQLSLFLKQKNIRQLITYFQVITPIKSGVLGAENLNLELQSILNAQVNPIDKLDLGFIKFNLFDKVIHIQNQDMDCYAVKDFKSENKENSVQRKRVFNGMVGLLFQINTHEDLLFVFYPNDELVVEYTFDEARDLLRLAYALTIHKTQGSEYQHVLIPMTFSHFMMLNNKLLYTAVTRAKDKCILVGEKAAFQSACKRKDVTVRDTVMRLI